MQNEDNVKKVKLPNGETYAYREAGSSSKVLLILHGASASSRVFSEFFPELSKTFRVIAVDFRAHGESSYNTPLSSHDDFVEDVKQFIETLDLKKFFVMGWSMGGNIAMKLAAQFPDQVEGLILHNPAGAKGFVVNKVDEHGNPTNERAQTKEEVNRHPYPIMVMSTIAKQDRETTRKYFQEDYFNGKNKLTPERLEVYVDEWLKCKCGDCLAYNSNRYNISDEHNGATEGTGEIFKITCKTLIIHGENDRCVPKKESDYIKNALGNLAQLKIFENSGHVSIEDYPQEVIGLITQFCSSINE